MKRPGRPPEGTGMILSGAPADEAIIKECALYIKGRIRDTNAADAWIAVGKALAQLKGQLVKRANRGDNERIGWVQAFPGQFGFGRRHADKTVEIYEFFNGRNTATKNLPASWAALHLIATKMQLNEVSSRIEDGSICPATTEKEISQMVKRPPQPAPEPPSPDAIASKVLRSLKQVNKHKQVDILISLCDSLGLTQKDLF